MSTPKRLTGAAAVTAARDQALGTPEEVRKAFLARRHAVPGLEMEPWSIGILWVLEEIQHPLVLTPPPLVDEAGRPRCHADGRPMLETRPLTAREIARALLAFADSEGAYEAICQGIEVYDSEAHKLARSLPPASVRAADALIPQIIREGLATMPGAGEENPPSPAAREAAAEQI